MSGRISVLACIGLLALVDVARADDPQPSGSKFSSQRARLALGLDVFVGKRFSLGLNLLVGYDDLQNESRATTLGLASTFGGWSDIWPWRREG